MVTEPSPTWCPSTTAKAARPAAVTAAAAAAAEGTTNWAWLDAGSSLRKVCVMGLPKPGRRSSQGSGHVNFQAIPQMLISRPGGERGVLGARVTSPHKLPFERAAMLGQATRWQCGRDQGQAHRANWAL